MPPTVDADRFAIRELVENWALWRDAGDWERFATVWHPTEGWMTATWFQGPAPEFIGPAARGSSQASASCTFWAATPPTSPGTGPSRRRR